MAEPEILVDVPGLGHVAFPAGTTPEVMEGAIQSALRRPPARTPSAPAAQRPGLGDQAMRGLGLGTRAAVEGLTSLPGMVYDAAAAPLNAGIRGLNSIAGANLPQINPASQNIAALTDAAGLPKPATQAEKITSGAVQGAASALPMLAGGAALQGAGGLAGAVGQGLAASPGMQVAAGAAGGAVEGGTDSPLAGTAAALAVPGIAALFGRVAAPVRPNENPRMRDALRIAEQEGISPHLTPGQQSGNQGLRRAEDMMRYVPGNGPAAINRGLPEAYNRAVLQRAGIQADYASPDVLEAQRAALGQRIDDVMSRNNLNLNPNTPEGLQNVQGLAAPLREARQYALPDRAQAVIDMYGNLLRQVQQGGVVPGERVRELRTALRDQIERTGNEDLKRYFTGIRDALTQGMDRSMVAADAADWQEANRQYANLMTIRGAMDRPTQTAAADNVSPSQLGAALKRSMGQGSIASGRGDLHDLVDVGKLLVEPSIKDSGTAGNQLVRTVVTGGLTGLTAIDPMTAALAYAPTAAYRGLAATGYLNPRNAPAALPEITPEVIAAVLAARGKSHAQPQRQDMPQPSKAALAAALLAR